ncbi:serine hydrolase [Streptomyces azureus]|uniref:serine hydrolase n=1 Tax=Streptomyces azureus TaxID=146537 RepID=UPI00099D26A0|nr:serine hydrolase [Streptomyces azureus]
MTRNRHHHRQPQSACHLLRGGRYVPPSAAPIAAGGPGSPEGPGSPQEPGSSSYEDPGRAERAHPPNSQPEQGSRPGRPGKWDYSDTSYVLAGMVIEKATGCSCAHAVERLVVRPLGLRGTSVPGTVPGLPSSHARHSKLAEGCWTWRHGGMIRDPRPRLGGRPAGHDHEPQRRLGRAATEGRRCRNPSSAGALPETGRPHRSLHVTVNGTGWISSALCPARSWMRWTASADGASERQ